MKMYWGSGGSSMPWTLYPQRKKELDSRLGEYQSQFGCSGEEKSPCPCQESIVHSYKQMLDMAGSCITGLYLG
jgi:sugar-specific transcriptional regulator TrmB